jgi:hypothetical protein
MTELTFSVPLDELAESISNMEHKDIIKLISLVLENTATVEVDEELVGRMWPIIVAAYENVEPPPTIEELVERFKNSPI